MSQSQATIAGGVVLVLAAVFYAATDRTTATSVLFALLLFAGFGLIARAWLGR